MAEETPIDRLVRDFIARLQDLPTSRDVGGFVGELKSIKDSIEALDLSTRRSVQAQNSMAKHYEGGSASVSASIASEMGPHGLWTPPQSGAGGPSVVKEEAEETRRGPLGRTLQRLQSLFKDPPPEDVADHRLRMPQIGEFTTQNALEWLSDSARHRGHTSTSNFLNKAAQGYAQFALVRQYAAKHGYETQLHTLEGTGGFQGTGAMVGATGGGDGLKIGPFGARIPFLDPQVRKGISEEWQKTRMAMGPGINKTGANTIFDNLYNLGWLGGDRTNQMRSAGAQIMRYNTQLGNNPAVYQAMDKATRMGTASLKDFVSIVKQVPDAAKAAHVSLDQIIQDGNAIGEINQSQGGTYFSGFRSSAKLAQITGLPSGMLAQGFNNPFVQSYAFRNTGLTPWMQGLQSPSERIQSVFGSINEMRGATTFKGRHASLGGVAGKLGFSEYFSGKDMQAAQLHQLFPEYSPEVLKKMLNPDYQQRVSAGVELLGATEAWSKKVGRISKQHPHDAARQLRDTSASFSMRTGKGLGDLGNLEKMMKMAVDNKGHRIFKPKEIEDIVKSAHPDPDAHWVKGTKAHWQSGGRGQYWHSATEGHMEGKTAAMAASEALKKLRKKWEQKMGNPSDPNAPKVTIDLSPAARKLFGIKSDNKDKANAGQTTVNVPSALGPTSVDQFGPGSGYYGR